MNPKRNDLLALKYPYGMGTNTTQGSSMYIMVNGSVVSHFWWQGWNDGQTANSCIKGEFHASCMPNQLRINDVVGNDKPKFLMEMPTEMTHATVLPGNEDKAQPSLTIPLDLLRGLISYFPTRKPTVEEFE